MAARLDEKMDTLTWTHCAVAELFEAPPMNSAASAPVALGVLPREQRSILVTRQLRCERGGHLQGWLERARRIAEDSGGLF